MGLGASCYESCADSSQPSASTWPQAIAAPESSIGVSLLCQLDRTNRLKVGSVHRLIAATILGQTIRPNNRGNPSIERATCARCWTCKCAAGKTQLGPCQGGLVHAAGCAGPRGRARVRGIVATATWTSSKPEPQHRYGSGLGRVCLDPAGAVEARLPVAQAHVVHPYLGAGPGRVDKFVVADVNTDMAESPAHGVEKNQVARL